MKKIKTWGKLMLMGEHSVVYGNSCIVSAVSKYMTVKADFSKSSDFFDTGKSDDKYLKSAVDVFRQKTGDKHKFLIRTGSEISGFGLGSSAAVTVGTIYILAKLLQVKLNALELFRYSYEAVKKHYPATSGFDLASVIYGNTILFNGKSKKTEIITKKKLPILIAFSGEKADTACMVKKVREIYEKTRNATIGIFNKIENLVIKGCESLKKKNWRKLGYLFNLNHRLLVDLGVSTRKIDKMIEICLNENAYGAKISGAGGGDCIITLIDPKYRNNLAQKLTSFGAKIIDAEVGGIEGLVNL